MTQQIPSREGGDSGNATSSRTAATHESQSRHSPLPWVVKPEEKLRSSRKLPYIWSHDGQLVVASYGLRDVDAAFIVRAVNSHAALVKACEQALDYLRDSLGSCDPDCECVIHPLEAALAKAKG